nr:RNA-directed DNA polymerase, eukaryota [Tanacetum cinerariifolium]
GALQAHSLNLSHMFYADDAIFMGQWSESNIDTIVQMLECFNRASGLRINMNKSKLLGISVEDDKVKQAAVKIDKGGLGVSSLFELNRALMFKWVWHFITRGSSLWARVIKALHGNDGKFFQKVKSCYPSIWLDIIHEVEMLKYRGIDLVSLIHSKLGNGANTSFWEVAWHGKSAFKILFPRGGVEQQQFEHFMEKVEGCILADMMDRWFWPLEGSGKFTVALVRKTIDDFMLPEVSSKTRWIKAVPIKVNVHAWKVKLGGLPTRLNISRRGIDIESVLCPMCGKAVESTSHIFFTCEMSKEILRKISRWWDIDYMEVSSYKEWLDWILNMRLSVKSKQLLEGVCYVLWWYVWSFRNKCIFGSQFPSKAVIFDDVLDLPEELSRVHNMFHVSNLKKRHINEPLTVPLDGLHFDDKLHSVEEPVEIMDREVKRLK